MRTITAIFIGAVSFAAAPNHASAAIAVGLTSTGLISFDTDSPAVTLGTSSFSGLNDGDTIVDLDYRPSDGQLYGTASSGRLYTIDRNTGSAIVNTSAGVGALGTVTDADFNPVADRLRIYSVGDANYRLTPTTGAVTNDGTLTYQAGDENEGQSPNLRASAYTNNLAGAVTTTLYSIDADFDTLVIHSGGPAFSTLGTVGLLNINGLSFNFSTNLGFDIYNAGGQQIAYASSGNTLFEVDLATADLAPLGTIGGAAAGPGILSLAIVPEPGSMLLAALPLGWMALRRKR